MSGVAIVTDSNSGITQEEAKRLGIFVLPMPFYIDGELFYEDISLTQEKFYERLTQDADISTSQPSPGDVLDIWEKALEEYDEVVLFRCQADCQVPVPLRRCLRRTWMEKYMW